MTRILLQAIVISMLIMPTAVAQHADPYFFDKIAQVVTVTPESLTRAQCDAGYQSGMRMSKAEFERACDQLALRKLNTINGLLLW